MQRKYDRHFPDTASHISYLGLEGAEEANDKWVLSICEDVSLMEHLVHLQGEGHEWGARLKEH